MKRFLYFAFSLLLAACQSGPKDASVYEIDLDAMKLRFYTLAL